MLTTDGNTLCATTTTRVRRDGPTDAGIGGVACLGWRLSSVCDSATGLQASKRSNATRKRFIGSRYTWTSMRLKLIYNPWAGRGRARHHALEVEQTLRALGA